MKILSTRATSPIGLKWNKYLGTFSQSSTNVGLSGGAAEPLFPSKVVLLVPKQRGQRGEWEMGELKYLKFVTNVFIVVQNA